MCRAPGVGGAPLSLAGVRLNTGAEPRPEAHGVSGELSPVSPFARIKMSCPEQQEHGLGVEKRWPSPKGPGVRRPLPSLVISSPCGEMPWEPTPGPCWARLSVYADMAQRVSWRTRQEPRSPANPGKAPPAEPSRSRRCLPWPPMLACADPSPRRGAEATAAPPQAAPACAAGKKMIL